MKFLFRIAFTLLLLCGVAHAAFETTRSVAPCAPTYDPLAPVPLFWLANPATLSLASPQFVAAYARPFGLSDLETGIAAVNLQRRALAFGIGLTSLGQSDLYRESDLNLAAALRLDRSLSIGTAAHWLDLRFGPRFAAWHIAAIDFGAWYESPRGIGVGISRSDQVVVQPTSRTTVRPVTRLALSYRYSPPLGLRAGFEYRDRWVFTTGETLLVADRLHIHADLLTAPLRLVVGLRLRTPVGFFDFVRRDHPDLGGDTILEWGTAF